ncbi:hypothetical protein CLPU_3c00850 [Gottschalkia purinilytica]|uniref:Uncharacterized protein n=1 Tax=Gottschalkia purinilytica TaxID=1503 RepID=A0A0L0WCW1_GOTPU|nr:hypothetical protein [Gottschalkia purinilytica]KNF09307.1 hypothetical protein CLPU_3c00850 [Gottschalkia purinilytica]
MASKKKYRVLTPNPRMYVALNELHGLWSDENKIIETDDKNIYDYLLNFSGFQDVSKL